MQLALMCNCEDFERNMESLTGDVLIFGHKREYKGKPLVFCPWCGKGLFIPIKMKLKPGFTPFMEASNAS